MNSKIILMPAVTVLVTMTFMFSLFQAWPLFLYVWPMGLLLFVIGLIQILVYNAVWLVMIKSILPIGFYGFFGYQFIFVNRPMLYFGIIFWSVTIALSILFHEEMKLVLRENDSEK